MTERYFGNPAEEGRLAAIEDERLRAQGKEIKRCGRCKDGFKNHRDYVVSFRTTRCPKGHRFLTVAQILRRDRKEMAEIRKAKEGK